MKCISCAGGIGILLCSIFMTLSVIGITTVGVSKNANANGMAGMDNTASQNMLVAFFSGFWGEVFLSISFVLMLFGIWFNNKRKVIPLSLMGVIILYVSMYVYYSISLEILGGILLAAAFILAYNTRLAKIARVV